MRICPTNLTHVTVLKESGFSNAAIAVNTGHKNSASVERYTRVRRDADFRAMSSALSVETSASQVSIRRVGQDGEVAISETRAIENKYGERQSEPAAIVVNFNGTFQNCTFNLTGVGKQ
ncbi:hypothetical protein BOX15_Mlig026654g1 [Macrostomum lignano]|uniref:Uncharacterized protein n=1 Tax=Macrostomum lignano TaxID=282301 RepID=A0A267DXB4_9PLAT|nr:hypothetical protein BOX15_Mlig026654g1 [Macrostomum lignano]